MKLFTIAIFLLCSSILTAQNNFPASWQGEWSGTLQIFTSKGKVQEVPMELHIFPTNSPDRYTWTIIYGEDPEAGKRPYELIVVDTAAGQYALDEKNSIRMEAYLLGGKLYQWFEVEGTLINTANWLEGEELVWELTSGKSEAVSITGDREVAGEKIPPVKSFPIGALQIARLRRG